MKTTKRFFILAILLSILFLAGCAGGSGRVDSSLKNVTNSGELVAVDGASHDWGDINIKGGDMKHTFTFKNEGSDDLILKSASTSCMCTKARYRLPDDSISPQYGMHGNSTSWAATIKPGETFGMEVTFDPMAHGPDATGPIKRSVKLLTSSKANSLLELTVSGNVLSKKDYQEKQASMPL